MVNLTQASRELFSRSTDERFSSVEELYQHCKLQREGSTDRWQLPQSIRPATNTERLVLALGSDGAFEMNDWSFTQLCQMAGVAKDTINRLSPQTACSALLETLPSADKPVQILTAESSVRSIHGVSYTRLWNENLLRMIREVATDFQPPPKGFNGATGLYCGEQDLFCFLIDPTGWIDIEGQNFAPGFFVWNSEVGRRSIGITTFWFQECCQNHIVWNCEDVMTVTRKHTRSVGDALTEIRLAISTLVDRRDIARDQFASTIRKAMAEPTGDKEETLHILADHGVNRQLAKRAVEMVATQGKRFTIWSLVDALTQLSRDSQYAATRVEADQRASALLALAA
ncbi:MAG: DUF932 domain-containing protein [Planctomycetes bacterium]|nr:DUF932 domain-containing protein [Planctomycetota bacterium]